MKQDHQLHQNHPHVHGKNCGHLAIKHDGHVDYLHDGHLHHAHDGHIDEHTLKVSAENPTNCNPHHKLLGHEPGHKHDESCGHLAIPHGDHVDYIVEGRLHHAHGDHCDDHGLVTYA